MEIVKKEVFCMVKVLLGSFITILFLICWSIYWSITAYWYWLVDPNNQAIVIASIASLISALIGALVGGIIGGTGSYLGGIRGAKQNYNLASIIAKKQLHKQLEYTIITFQYYIKKQESTGQPSHEIHKGTFLYDLDWPKHLSLINCLTDNDEASILVWFNKITRLEIYGENHNGIIAKEYTSNIITNKDLNNLIEISNKLLN